VNRPAFRLRMSPGPPGIALALVVLLSIPPGCTTRPVPEAGPPRFEAVLKPLVGADGEVAAIEVDSVIHGALSPEAERLSLTAPVVYAGAYGIADRVKDLTVTDRRGRIRLKHEDDPINPAGFPFFRHWQAQRAVSFPVRVSYRAVVEPWTDRRGPPFNLKPSRGGVSGAGSGFLVIPENVDAEFSVVRWDLGEFGPGATAVSSFGESAFELPGPPKELWPGWYMAGMLGRYPDKGDADGFSSAWLGDFPFDPQEAMHLVGAGYAWLADFFGYLAPPPRYRVFMRVIDSPQTRFSGTALGGSFLLSGGPNSGQETDNEAPRGTFFHEMIHMWVGQVEGPPGVTSWFSEGLTSYYTLVLPVRGGFDTVEDLHAGINRVAERYYLSPALGMSAQAIADVGFGDEDIRSAPYARGALYFADLDGRIRAASGGERGLDDLMHGIFERRHNDPDYTFDREAWLAAVTAELGPEAVDEFQARIIEGAPFAPVSNAFGPCFEIHLTTFEKDGKRVPGYEWLRVPDIPDDQCTGG
jgi:hypothetical protein